MPTNDSQRLIAINQQVQKQQANTAFGQFQQKYQQQKQTEQSVSAQQQQQTQQKQPQTSQPTPSEQPLPFMAKAVTEDGTAYYGTGFQGWARSTFAKIYDPKFITSNISDNDLRQAAESDVNAQKYGEQFNKLTRWDQWGEQLFGIKAEEFGAVKAAVQAEKQDVEQKGESVLGTAASETIGQFGRAAVQGGMTLLGAFGVIDYAKRKDIMARQAQYELAQQSDLYKAAKEAGAGEWLLGRGPKWEADYVPNGGFIAENPVVGNLADPLRWFRQAFQAVAIMSDKDTRGKYLPTLKKYQQGSGMAYTMVSDAAKRQQFVDAVNRGDDPGFAAAQYGNLWTEVGGSIVNDPTTYMGMSVVGKGKTVLKIPFTNKAISVFGKELSVPWQKIFTTPTFGELLGVGLKSNATKAALKFTSAIPEAVDEVARMEKVAQEAGGWEKIADETEAFEKVKTMGANLLNTVKGWDGALTASKLPSARTLTTSSVKAQVFYRNAFNSLGMVLSRGGTIDERLESLSVLGRMFKGEDATRAEAAAMAVKEYGQLAMSDSFLQLGKFVAHFEDDEDVLRIMTKTGESPVEVFGSLSEKLKGFTEQFYPSMDEMADAARKLEEGAGDIAKAKSEIAALEKQVADFSYSGKVKPRELTSLEGDLNKAKSAFEQSYGKQQTLKDAYEQIDPLARRGREVLKKYEQVFVRPVKKYMDTVFLAWRPAQYMKQLQSQTALIAMDLGFTDAIEIAGRTAVTSFSDKWTAQMLERNGKEIEQILGFIPEAMTRGVTAAGEAKGAGALKWSGNIDTLMSSEITLRTVRREMDKVLRNSRDLLDLKKLEGVFNQDEMGLFSRLLSESGGNERKAIEQFTKEVGKGSFEAWRYAAMPDTLKDFTQQNKSYEELLKIQKTAHTRQEFMEQVTDLIERVTKQAQRAASADPPVVDETTNEVIRKTFLEAQELADKGFLNEGETKIFNNMINAYEYMRRNIEDGAKAFRNSTDLMAHELGALTSPEYRSAVQALDEATSGIHDIYPRYDETARLVRGVLKENKNLSSLERAQMLDNARFDVLKHTGYTLEELSTLAPREFEKVVWPAYFEWGREYWKDANTEILARTVESMDALAESAGANADKIIAGNSTVREYLYNARKYQQQATIWENNTRYFSSNLGQVANAYGVPTVTEKGVPLSKNILKILNENLPEGVKPFENYRDAEARIDDARVALAQWEAARNPEAANQALGKIDKFLRDLPPVVTPGTATGAQTMHANLIDDAFKVDLQAWTDKVTEDWGKLTETSGFSGDKRLTLQAFQKELTKKMDVVRAKVTKLATIQRDDILLNYDKSYGDLAMAYFKPYHYWQTHQYEKMAGRFLDHPSWANSYLKYKQAMSDEHKDLPEWWRYNISIQDLPGIHLKNPVYLNLESAINPIYDLTGTDFNDPYKRVDWLSRAVDDLGKVGGTFTPAIQWLVALNLYRKGEDDAATRWMGRLLGQTGTAIKAGLTLAGADVNVGKFIQHNEIDPFTNFLSGGLDPQERKRIGRTLSGMVEQGFVTPEQAVDAMYAQSGDLYDQARTGGVLDRAPAELRSFFLGVNLKPRTEQDAQIDTFYQEYYQLRAQSSLMSPEDYRQGFDILREKYPFMDVVLLAGKDTPDRNAAFGYNVLGRLPPAKADDYLKLAGISREDISKFYDSHGFTDESVPVTKAERDRFMAGISDLAAMTVIPSRATSQEWRAARNAYSDMKKLTDQQFGTQVQETIHQLGLLKGAERDQYRAAHPEIQAVKDFENEYIINNPLLYEYYGGLETIQQYQNGKMYDALDAKFGDMQPLFDRYYELQLTNPKAASRFKKEHPQMDAYNKYKAGLQQMGLAALVQFAGHLPDAPELDYRSDFQPENPVQSALQGYNQGQQQPSAQEFAQSLGDPLMNIIVHYYADLVNDPTKARLPYQASRELDFQSGKLGYGSGDDLLRDVLISLGQ